MYELTSAYHHIRVVDVSGLRTLCFDDAEETRMTLREPLKGHFEYTEYFHMPWSKRWSAAAGAVDPAVLASRRPPPPPVPLGARSHVPEDGRVMPAVSCQHQFCRLRLGIKPENLFTFGV